MAVSDETDRPLYVTHDFVDCISRLATVNDCKHCESVLDQGPYLRSKLGHPAVLGAGPKTLANDKDNAAVVAVTKRTIDVHCYSDAIFTIVNDVDVTIGNLLPECFPGL